MIIGNLCQCGNLKRGTDTLMCRECYHLLREVRGEGAISSPAVRKPIPAPKERKPVRDTCKCGESKYIRAELCWDCHIKARKEASIPKRYCSCGKEIRPHNKSGMCIKCFKIWRRKNRTQQLICECGRPKHSAAKRCWRCTQEEARKSA